MKCIKCNTFHWYENCWTQWNVHQSEGQEIGMRILCPSHLQWEALSGKEIKKKTKMQNP